MANLLDKASILLTPTAYDNGSMLSVKPTNGDGDFTFSRNSAATRVNAQGLVENVQILSGDLVQNGSFSEIGAEQVTNGSFTNGSTDWTLQTGWSIGDGLAIYDNSTLSFISQSFTWEVGKTYKLTFDVGDFITNHRFDLSTGSTFIKGSSTDTNTSYTFYVTGDGGNILRFRGFVNEVFSITNISVKEVGQDWTFGDGFTPDQANSKATCDGTQSAVTNLTQTISTNIQNKLVRVSFTLDYTAGVLLGSLSGTGAVDFNNITSSGTYTAEMTSNEVSPQLILQGDANFIGSITNIVIKEITNDTNLPRINYENGCGSWLFEPQSTNYGRNSEQPSTWHSSGGVTITANAATSPEGLQNSSLVVNNASSGSRYARNLFNFPSGSGLQTVTVSYFIKYYNNQWIRLKSIFFNGSPANNLSTWFDVQNGVVGTVGANHTAKIEDYSNGWYRCSITFDIDKSVDPNGYVHVEAMDGDNSNTYAANGKGFYAYGSQAEEQSYATSYIPTLGATSTRIQDLASGSGNATLINSTEGVLYAEIARNANEGSSPGIQINDGSNNNNLRLFFNQANTISVITRVGGSNNVVKTAQAITSSTAMNKFALVWKLNDYKLYYNGAELWNDTSASVYPVGTLNNLDFLNQTTPFKGEVKALAVFPYLTDAELQSLTTI